MATIFGLDFNWLRCYLFKNHILKFQFHRFRKLCSFIVRLWCVCVFYLDLTSLSIPYAKRLTQCILAENILAFTIGAYLKMTKSGGRS